MPDGITFYILHKTALQTRQKAQLPDHVTSKVEPDEMGRHDEIEGRSDLGEEEVLPEQRMRSRSRRFSDASSREIKHPRSEDVDSDGENEWIFRARHLPRGGTSSRSTSSQAISRKRSVISSRERARQRQVEESHDRQDNRDAEMANSTDEENNRYQRHRGRKLADSDAFSATYTNWTTSSEDSTRSPWSSDSPSASTGPPPEETTDYIDNDEDFADHDHVRKYGDVADDDRVARQVLSGHKWVAGQGCGSDVTDMCEEEEFDAMSNTIESTKKAKKLSSAELRKKKEYVSSLLFDAFDASDIKNND
jgi:hypothetical protein